jgi:hypothetical protein
MAADASPVDDLDQAIAWSGGSTERSSWRDPA